MLCMDGRRRTYFVTQPTVDLGPTDLKMAILENLPFQAEQLRISVLPSQSRMGASPNWF